MLTRIIGMIIGMLALTAGNSTAHGQPIVVQPYAIPPGVQFTQTITTDAAGAVVERSSTVSPAAVPQEPVASGRTCLDPTAKVSRLVPAQASGLVDVIVAFQTDDRLPILPRLYRGLSRDSAANLQILNSRRIELAVHSAKRQAET
jgi:hypothetical protein